jgi:myo-inositol-1(or 4)-monophosphatase
MARRAGEILRRGYPHRPSVQNDLQIRHKSAIDLVTRFDYESEAYLLEEIRRRFPSHRILSEESGSLGDGQGDGLWVIDPLDGTVNFSHGIPIFSVSIAFAQGDQISLGVVYDPLRDEMFSAERGKGATLNSLPVRVSPLDALDQSLLVTGFPYDIRTRPDKNLEEYARLALLSQGVRRLGAASLDLCYVASGRFDGYWELMLNPWDLAAGVLIAQEAGARVTTIDGGTEFLTGSPSIVAANPSLHESLLQVLHVPD